MATTRTTFTLNRQLVEQAHRSNINISAAERAGVRAAVRGALVRSDREVYRRNPERADPFWNEAETWGDG